jgi:stalled ribosome rescue protein Dom34
MTTQAGLWIDHRKAVIVLVSDEGEETRVIESNVERHVRYSHGAQREPEDTRERRFEGELSQFYDEVIACIHDVEAILIFGPGEAKGELKARLERSNRGDRVLAIETVDKMTDRQIAARVRRHFSP